MTMEPPPPLTAPWSRAARLAVLAACVLGVVLAQDSASADPIAPKEFFYALALGLLPALAALRLWWGAPLRFPAKPALSALAVFCGAVSVAFLASPLPQQSRPSWQAWLLSVPLYVACVDLLAEEDGRRRLLGSLGLGAGLAGAFSLAQRLGLDTGALGSAEAAQFGSRAASSFGNPNFAGGFFALVLPVLVHQALAGEGRVRRWAFRAAAASAALGLVLSAGKAALFGFLFSAALAGHLLFWSDAAPAARRRGLTRLGQALGLVLALGVLCLPKDALLRVAGGPAAWTESVDFRAVTWAGTWDLFRARPLSGWGPGTFSAAYPAYRRPEAMAAQTQHAYEVTEPEDWPLQLLAETGVLGLGAALFLLGVLLWPLRRSARDWERDPQGAGLCLALCCSVGACLACNLASLDLFLPSTLLPLILLLALGTALSAERAPALSLGPQRGTARRLVSLGLLCLASAPVVPAFLHVQACRRLAQGEALSRAGRFNEAVPDYQLAVQFDPGLLEARYFLGCSLLDTGGAANLEAAGGAFDALRRYAPDYVQVHAKLGRLYQSEGRVDEAVREYGAQAKLDPWDLETVQALAGLEAEHGRLAEAQSVLEDAARRWPADADIARNLGLVRAALNGKQGKGRT